MSELSGTTEQQIETEEIEEEQAHNNEEGNKNIDNVLKLFVTSEINNKVKNLIGHVKEDDLSPLFNDIKVEALTKTLNDIKQYYKTHDTVATNIDGMLDNLRLCHLKIILHNCKTTVEIIEDEKGQELYKELIKQVNEQIKIINENLKKKIESSQSGGIYHKKYLKYKSKYTTLKYNKMNHQ